MGAARFYHLTYSPVEATLPLIIERSLKEGWRVAVRGTSAERMEWLDQKLWLGADDGFLPHGLAGGAHDADQPVLLTTVPDAPNGAACLIAMDGAAVAPEEVASYERVCILFDGNDPEAVAAARGQWSALVDAGCAAQYWSEEGGRWQMKAER